VEPRTGTPAAHKAGDLLGPVSSAMGSIRAIGAFCHCRHPECGSTMARELVRAAEVIGKTPRPAGHEVATVTYDPEMVELARVAALRVKAGKKAQHGDMTMLATAFEELTRTLT
jgi:hypothetical protein